MKRVSDTPEHLRGDLWAIVSALATAAGLSIAKIALEDITPLTFNTYVFFFGSIIIFADAAIRGQIREMILVPPRMLGFYFILALLFSGSTFCLFTAISYIEPATASFLSRLELIATLLLATIFLKEKVTKVELFGLLFVIAGIIVMRYGASLELSRAVLLVSVGAVFVGSAEVAIKARIKRINPRSLIFYRGVFMVVIFLIVGNATEQVHWVGDTKLLLLLGIAAIFLPYIGRFGYLKAMEYINISRASIIVQSQPFFAAGITFMLIGTFPTLKEIAGGLLIVTGVVFIKILEIKAPR